MKIKVRIALAVAENGEWNACGWNPEETKFSEEAMMDSCVDGVVGEARRYWIEAEVETPTLETITATATPA